MYFEHVIEELDPTPWTHMIVAFPEQCRKVVKTRPNVTKMDEIEWFGIRPLVLLGVLPNPGDIL